MQMSRATVVAATLCLVTSLGAGCASSKGAESKERAAAEKREKEAKQARIAARHTGLDATLWTQSSAEREATTLQAYRLARLRLDDALGTPGWTASLEQKKMGGYREKPPAVIVDVDETVLDNSAYQARLVRQGESFDIESWNAWCREANASAVPGAVDFAQYADKQGVTVFYVTNRQHAVEESTRKNLDELGFPIEGGEDVILTKNEKEEWGSDKTPRRKAVAENYRILLQIGDNLGDFVGETEVEAAKRAEKVKLWSERWGKHWIALANPMYGDWEATAYGYDYELKSDEKLQKKLDSLDVRKDE